MCRLSGSLVGSEVNQAQFHAVASEFLLSALKGMKYLDFCNTCSYDINEFSLNAIECHCGTGIATVYKLLFPGT